MEPLSSRWLIKAELPELSIRDQYVSYDLYEEGKYLSGSTVILSLPKFFCYEDPHLSVTAREGWVTVTADAYAKSVEIQNENEDLILEDNYFDLNGGSRTLKVLSGETKNLRARSVYNIR